MRDFLELILHLNLNMQKLNFQMVDPDEKRLGKL